MKVLESGQCFLGFGQDAGPTGQISANLVTKKGKKKKDNVDELLPTFLDPTPSVLDYPVYFRLLLTDANHLLHYFKGLKFQILCAECKVTKWDQTSLNETLGPKIDTIKMSKVKINTFY